MPLKTITTRADEDLYKRAQKAAIDLGVTIQETVDQCLKDLVERAEDPGKRATERGMEAVEMAQEITGLIRDHLLSNELEEFTRSARRIIEGKK